MIPIMSMKTLNKLQGRFFVSGKHLIDFLRRDNELWGITEYINTHPIVCLDWTHLKEVYYDLSFLIFFVLFYLSSFLYLLLHVKYLEIYKGQGQHQQKLLSPSAPEAPRQ